MAVHVIVGKGPVGTTTAQLLAARGQEVRVISRSGGRSTERLAHVAADASDPESLRGHAHGAAVIYNCLNPAYHRWTTDWPPMATAILDTAEQAGAVLVTMGNLYGYGPVDHPIREGDPLAALGTKGRVRNEMWRQALARHEAGRIRIVEARASDFFGPEVRQSHVGERVMPSLLAGKAVRVLGDPDAPHTWSFMPDVARTLVRLGAEERAWGKAWHVPSPPPVSQREYAAAVCRAAGQRPARVKRLPWSVVRAIGVAMPAMRELQETRYQFDRAFVLDSSAYTAEFGETATPFDNAVGDTVRWWRAREDVAVPSGP